MERADLGALLRWTGCAEERGGWCFLCAADWGPDDRAAANEQLAVAAAMPAPKTGWLCLRTGGTRGGVRFARHDERTLASAADGFVRHFGFDRVNAINLLPAWHVGGLMPHVRSALTGGDCRPWNWSRLAAGDCPDLPDRSDGWTVSLVPTQLQRLLSTDVTREWMRGFRLILLGGGPVWPALADAAAARRLPVTLSYGMTESAAVVTAQRTEDFAAGDRSCGRALPHACVTVTAAGLIRVAGNSVFRGYFPQSRKADGFVSGDLGRLDENGRLHVAGRNDSVIITGGKKVAPEAVEAVLRRGGFSEVAVIGVPDPVWGEAVVACHPAEEPLPDISRATAGLAPHERPKRFVPVAPWPRDAQGKLDLSALRACVMGKEEKTS